MTHVVTDNCLMCMYTECVTSCPVNCFYTDNKMLYIHPDECIDCGDCLPRCPVKAIFTQDGLPDDKQDWLDKNRAACEAGAANITEKRDPLPTAEAKKAQLGF